MRFAFLVVASLLITPTLTNAQQPVATSDSADVHTTYRRWWHALTTGDTATVALLSSPTLSTTLSTSETLDRAGVIKLSALSVDSSQVRLEWSEESVRIIGNAAVITSRMLERVGQAEVQYRYLTTLERTRAGWRVLATQSTRIPRPSPKIALPVAALEQYEGRYRTPNGRELRVTARDSVLALRTPDGNEQIIAPVSDAVFEIRTSRARFDVVRFVFERDESGRVTRVTRLAPAGVTAFPRVQ